MKIIDNLQLTFGANYLSHTAILNQEPVIFINLEKAYIGCHKKFCGRCRCYSIKEFILHIFDH